MKNYRSYIILTIAIIMACFYRLFNLGSTNLWVDEYYHVFASKSLLNMTGPLMPSGLRYMTALSFTLVVTFFRAIFGASIFVYRLPSAFFGVLLIPVVYFLVRKVANEKAALIIAVLVAFDPFGFWWSRICRHYTMFELFFFVSAFLLFSLLSDFSFDKKNIKWWAAFIVIFGITVSLHPLGLLLPVAAAVYVLAAYIMKLDKKSKFLLVVSGATLILTCVALYLSKSFSPSSYYIRVFAKLNPLFILFVLMSCGYCLLKKKNFGIFAGILFLSALTIHTFFFPDRTHSRYMLYSVPFAYAVLAIPFGDFVSMVTKGESNYRKNILTVFSAVIVMFYGRTMVAQSYSMAMSTFPKYSRAIKVLKNNEKNSKKAIVVSTLPVATTYYYGKTDYYLRANNYQNYVFKKKGQVREIYTGAVLVNNGDRLRDITLKNKKVWVFAESRLYKYCDEDIRRAINNYYKPVYVDKAYQITLFQKK